MNKITLLLCLHVVFSCGNKQDVLLPKSNVSVVTEVLDNSPIYIFLKIDGKDTLADVNRKNSIISTNWLVNIDKRLPLKVVIPEVIKLQEKKRQEKAHKNDKAKNYYSYADSIGKNIAFIPFTNVYYQFKKPKKQFVVYFATKKTILVNGMVLKKEDLIQNLDSLSLSHSNKFIFGFNKNIDFGSYIQYKILVQKYCDDGEQTVEYIF